jgi:hypothetical protein
MPMIYGEGAVQAFIRLQRAIMEQSDDQSLFAWRQGDGLAGHGMLATSPTFFAESSSFMPIQEDMKNALAYRMTNRGLEIQLDLTCTLEGGNYIALLTCGAGGTGPNVGIYLILMDDGRFIRTRLDQLSQFRDWLPASYKVPTPQSLYVPQLYLSETPTQQSYYFQLTKSAVSALKGNYDDITDQCYILALTTLPGLTNDLSFTLKAGGRAGVLFSRSDVEVSQSEQPRFSPFVVILFGVEWNGSIFAEIDEVTEPHYQAVAWGIRKDTESGRTHSELADWLENYALERVLKIPKGKRNLVIQETEFKLWMLSKESGRRSSISITREARSVPSSITSY